MITAMINLTRSTVTTMTDPINSDGTYPGCGALDSVQSQPAPFLDRLTATVAMRQVIELADDAATLTDERLRDRLLALAGGHVALSTFGHHSEGGTE